MNLTQSEIDLDLGSVTMSCSTDEIATVLAGLLREMRSAAPFIRPDERDVLRQIMAHDSGALAVAEVFPDFARGSEAHTTLRKLRTAQFIRPAGRDCWGPHEHIEIRPFARVVWDRLGEAGVFGDPPALDEDDVDLALPGADDPAEEQEPEPAPARRGKRAGAQWDEGDVLDFLNDEDTKG
ncbi:hypothetical protein VT84_29120 [Gemmata sp. SH-PL17]|uniref:hypothetical protein n=1 Tax=Gemmata sp. SH-PL17 TaxID=1630693 RepID=UPI00078C1DD0|nr:hypothetical protein [Gemmata sp. SH-PL17]AMV28502.1 hypothetical protein VT84_29120 [Gemmata sp. SH-PL17]